MSMPKVSSLSSSSTKTGARAPAAKKANVSPKAPARKPAVSPKATAREPAVSPKAPARQPAAKAPARQLAVSLKAPARNRGVVAPKPAVRTFPYEYMTLQQRKKIGQGAPDYSTKDKVMHYMLANAETLEQPKMVVSKMDWLAVYESKEKG